MTSEKFCLKWNDFKDNARSSFSSLRADRDFTDVTLVCDGNQPVEAHKVILSAASPLLSNMLKQNKHSHPLIYMRKTNANDFLSILDFMYFGEANVYQEDIDRFLALAEELHLKGLTSEEKKDDITIQQESKQANLDYFQSHNKPKLKRTLDNEQLHDAIVEDNCTIDKFEQKHQIKTDNCNSSVGTLALLENKNVTIQQDQHLNKQIESMMEKQDGIWTCKLCGKKSSQGKAVTRTHIERNHIDGVSLPCGQCDAIFRSHSSLAVHVMRNHRK